MRSEFSKAQSQQQKQDARSGKGLCLRCGRQANLQRGKGRWCNACLDRAAERMRGRRSRGDGEQCYRCLARPPVKDGRYCQPCLDRQPQAVARFQAKVRPGYCTVCRQQEVETGYSGRCGGCVLKHRSRGRVYYHRRRRRENPDE